MGIPFAARPRVRPRVWPRVRVRPVVQLADALKLCRFARDENGATLVEGAVISNFLVFVLVCMLEIVAYFTTAAKVTEAADGVASMVAHESR